ncbi:hypothetical protein [Bacteriovorax sp. Seq25_V]|uniref:hypothetical protein n=1 Tax=Bacteriovorax sp. Seq25_V TaxID=1201288 RepID=UPI00038A37DD|nr:hypothetical protein [Bacteriovorax sp. Seq25_V]EQC47324.1 hypothetical protein M900_0863 [Bacteriovorax sp. Seq25_V]
MELNTLKTQLEISEQKLYFAEKQVIAHEHTITVLLAIIAIVIATFSFINYSQSEKIVKMKENLDNVINSKINALIEGEYKKRISQDIQNYFKRETYFEDSNAKIFHSIKGGRPIENNDINFILNFLKNKKVTLSKISNFDASEYQLFISVVHILSRIESNDIITNYFDQFIYAPSSLVEPKVTDSVPFFSANMGRVYSDIAKYYSQDESKNFEQIKRLLEIQRENKNLHDVTDSLKFENHNEVLVNIFKDIFLQHGFVIRKHQNNVHIVDSLMMDDTTRQRLMLNAKNRVSHDIIVKNQPADPYGSGYSIPKDSYLYNKIISHSDYRETLVPVK